MPARLKKALRSKVYGGLGRAASEIQLPQVFDAIDMEIGEATDGKVAKGGVRNWGDVGFCGGLRGSAGDLTLG